MMNNIDISHIRNSEYKLYINSCWAQESTGDTIISMNPYNGMKRSYFIDATYQDIDPAIEMDKERLKDWQDVDVKIRTGFLLTIADLIDENRDRQALMETLDNGKPLCETKGVDIPESTDHFRHFAGIIRAGKASLKIKIQYH